MTAVFEKIIEMSLTSAVVIVVVMAIRLLLRKAPRKYSYALWIVAAFRLVCPVSFRAVFSIFNFAKRLEQTEIVQVTPDPIPSADPLPDGFLSTPPGMTGDPIVLDPDYVFTYPVTGPEVTVQPNIPEPEVTVNLLERAAEFAAVVWLIGLAALVIYGIVSYVRLSRRMATAVLSEDGVWLSDQVQSPFILGFVKPKIYLPFGLSEDEQRYVLAHERYHLKRLDHIVRPLSFLILAVHWFNPFVWAAYYLMGADMEMSCDEKVLSTEKNIRKAYSTTLLSFAANRRFPSPSPLAFGEGGVKKRIKNALNWKRPRTWVTVIAIVVCIVVIVVCAANPAGHPYDWAGSLTVDAVERAELYVTDGNPQQRELTKSEISELVAQLNQVKRGEYGTYPKNSGWAFPTERMITLTCGGIECVLNLGSEPLTISCKDESVDWRGETYWHISNDALKAFIRDLEEPSIDNNHVDTVKEIESITNNGNYSDLPDVEEPFFEDSSYIYGFGNPISQYVIVKYTDGSSEDVKEALEHGHIQITDLDRYNIYYYAEPKLIENIVDLTQSGELFTNDALETFYADDDYHYIFGSMKSHYVIVYYKDGTEQNVKEALAEGKIRITDLDWFGIGYWKEPNVVTQTLAVHTHADLTHDGVRETITLTYREDWQIYYLTVENAAGEKLWQGEAGIVHAGWDGFYLYDKDGKQYLMRWLPAGSTGIFNYGYEIFSLTETGEQVPLTSGALFYDSNSVEGILSLEVERLEAFAAEVNALLEDTIVLVTTDEGTPYYSTRDVTLCKLWTAPIKEVQEWKQNVIDRLPLVMAYMELEPTLLASVEKQVAIHMSDYDLAYVEQVKDMGGSTYRVTFRPGDYDGVSRVTWEDSRYFDIVKDEDGGYVSREETDFLAGLPAEIVTPDTLPTDPEEYYLVAALPENHVYLYAKNRGEDSLLLWSGNFWWPLKGRAAHTYHMNLPRLYLMDENAKSTTVAAVSERDCGTGVSIEQLVVYVMGEHQADSSYYAGLKQSVYDWSSIHESFNKKNTLFYDADTNTFTVFWSGTNYNSGELAEDIRLSLDLEDGYVGSLFASGDIIKFTYAGGNRFVVAVKTAVEGRPSSIGVTGLDLIWTVEFNGEGFDLVGEISLGSEAGAKAEGN